MKKINNYDSEIFYVDATGSKDTKEHKYSGTKRITLAQKSHDEKKAKMDESGIRCITKQEAKRLLIQLPEHIRAMAEFTLATGLKESYILGLKWDDISLNSKLIFILPSGKAYSKTICVFLNNWAIGILMEQKGKHSEWVFTYKGSPIKRASNTSWKNALEHAGIVPYKKYQKSKHDEEPMYCPIEFSERYKYHKFIWRNLQDTWVQWHLQAGTPIHIIMQLCGGINSDRILRTAALITPFWNATLHVDNVSLTDSLSNTNKHCYPSKNKLYCVL